MCRAQRRCGSQMPESVNIFVMPPSPQALETRLRNRSRAEGSISESDIQTRLAKGSRRD